MMRNNNVVGNVFSIDGQKVTAIMRQNTNMITYFYDGEKYRGVNIGEYIGVIRGPYLIVGRVEKEFLNDKKKDNDDQTYSIDRFQRFIEFSIVGYFYGEKFEFGIKCLPMIFNEIVLLSENDLTKIISKGIKRQDDGFSISIGRSIQEEYRIELPIDGLFNSHIGVFGNTGSGKSNTLTKLYTELFNFEKLDVTKSSEFVLLDFNGEYVGKDVFNSEKQIINLSTRTNKNNSNDKNTLDKITILPSVFWSVETLSILFSATEKTQQPFIRNTLNFYVPDYNITSEDLIVHIVNGFKNVFEANNNKQSLIILNKIYTIIGLLDNKDITLSDYSWNATTTSFYKKDKYIKPEEIQNKIDKFSSFMNNYKFASLTEVDKLLIILNLQLIYGLRNNHIQFEHISPLISRVESLKPFIEKTINVGEDLTKKFITIISMKDCNQDAKRILPLLISKQLYNNHIYKMGDEITKTCHIIIDEAHNILSEQSTREAESFKDYRLEVFEQMIKEGRKFGFYLTISSQRPYDISPTIMSQISNYFIHKLVNELDLKMINNTVSSLDNLSKERISLLAPGQCVITGNLFDLPMLIQVDKLDDATSPNSKNSDLINLWKKDI